LKQTSSCYDERLNQIPFWIKFKGILFLIIGILSSVLLIIETQFSWRVAIMLVIAIWCFCRFLLLRILRYRNITSIRAIDFLGYGLSLVI